MGDDAQSECVWVNVAGQRHIESAAMSDFLRENIPLIVATVCVVGLWLLLRNKATRLDSISDFDAKVAQGRPLVLEFFSNG